MQDVDRFLDMLRRQMRLPPGSTPGWHASKTEADTEQVAQAPILALVHSNSDDQPHHVGHTVREKLKAVLGSHQVRRTARSALYIYPLSSRESQCCPAHLFGTTLRRMHASPGYLRARRGRSACLSG